MRSPSPGELLAVGERIAVAAGRIARDRRENGVAVLESKSSPEDIVTAVDRDVEAMIRAALRAERPGDGFFGEESGEEVSRTGITWVVDPIDGTVNYLYGLPQYAVSIAAVAGEPEAGDALAGVVANTAAGEIYTAIAGGGARCNGRAITVSTETSLTMALIDTGFSYRAAERLVQAAVMADLIPVVRDIRRLGAASLDLCAVACGRVDGYFERHLNPWDVSAGVLIAREAGAIVTSFDGARTVSRDIVAAGAGIHTALRSEIAKLYQRIERRMVISNKEQ